MQLLPYQPTSTTLSDRPQKTPEWSQVWMCWESSMNQQQLLLHMAWIKRWVNLISPWWRLSNSISDWLITRHLYFGNQSEAIFWIFRFTPLKNYTIILTTSLIGLKFDTSFALTNQQVASSQGDRHTISLDFFQSGPLEMCIVSPKSKRSLLYIWYCADERKFGRVTKLPARLASARTVKI